MSESGPFRLRPNGTTPRQGRRGLRDQLQGRRRFALAERLQRGSLVAVFTIAAVLSGRATVAQEQVGPVRHSATIAGVRIDYDAKFETFPVAEPGRAPGATVTAISYVRWAKKQRADERPVLFAWGGGPGGSSIFLNVGMLGPMRIDLPADVTAPAKLRYPLVRNDDSILDVADVVLIDPVETGFSRLKDQGSRGYFFSVQGDAAAVSDVIESWSRLHGRTGSPKYLLGVSYGTVRTVEVGNNLAARPQIAPTLKGLVLVSPSLGIRDTVQSRTNVVGYALALKMMAATSWYHKRAGQEQSLEEFATRAGVFAANEWLPALLAGTSLDMPSRQRVAAGLATFTGLPAKYFLDNDLYLSKVDYRRLVLADRGLIVGENDSRYTGPSTLDQAPDAFLGAAMPAAAADVLLGQLGIRDSGEYRAQRLQLREWLYIKQPFNMFDRDDYMQLDYLARLTKVMSDRPDLRVFIGGGWFDTTATAGAQDYQITRRGLDLQRMTVRRYPGGHSYFSEPQSRQEFGKDLRAFIAQR